MAIESPVSQGAATGTYPYALLRACFPYYTTLGMRRVTTACMDVALGGEGRFYAISRDDGQGGLIRRSNWDDEDLGTISGAGTEPGKLMWPVQLILDKNENLYVSDEGTHRISAFNRDGELLGHWGEAGSGPGQLNRPSGIEPGRRQERHGPRGVLRTLRAVCDHGLRDLQDRGRHQGRPQPAADTPATGSRHLC